ncbi:XdhC family protein [Phytoactinopolyspora endophytica]|uniref:XdhC family protein n=1 Tax=Phytoactinopolyspora endophytica TaxID=1642495 RepID=UPI00101BB879|nr:XdhC family protein [Phytoactinopolyspora endophytica]
MRDILPNLESWMADGLTFAIGTVVGTWSSAPRQPGASMAVRTDGEVIGSVSGGCVEGAVYEECREAIASGEPRLVRYGVSDDDAFSVGLTCGGILDIFIQPADEERRTVIEQIAEAVRARRPICVATVVAGDRIGRHVLVTPDDVLGWLGDGRLTDAVVDHSRGLLARGASGTITLGSHGERRKDELSVFVESFAPPPRLIVFGAIDFASAVARIGKFLGHHVIVCDARPVFATATRFPEADEIIVDWPHRFLERAEVDRSTSLCVLTHDPKFDVPLLVAALQTPAAYIGAMGSRRTHEDRLRLLRDEGVSEESLARLRSPIGLDLGARTPEETAVSIAAELIATAWGGSGRALTDTATPIHAPAST